MAENAGFDQKAWEQQLKDLEVNISNFRFLNQDMLNTLKLSIETMETLADLIAKREDV